MPQPPFPEIRGQEAPPDVSRGPNRLPLFGSAKVRIAQTFAKINAFRHFLTQKCKKEPSKARRETRRAFALLKGVPLTKQRGMGSCENQLIAKSLSTSAVLVTHLPALAILSVLPLDVTFV